MSKFLHRYILAPLSVSTVVVTLGAAFGVLSGRGAIVGMVSAVVVALLTGFIGGTRFGVTSPTGPMTAAVGVILLLDSKWLATHASTFTVVELLNVTVLISAIMLALFALFRVQRLIKYVPQIVVAGFVNGIAVLIVMAQLRAVSTITDLWVMLLTFILAFLASYFTKKLSHIVWRVLAGSFFVIVTMSVLVILFGLDVTTLEVTDKLSGLEFAMPPLHKLWEVGALWFVLGVSLELALIGLLDTLLTAVLMEQKTAAKSNYGQELVGQSVAMAAVSLFGGLPSAQSTVPSIMFWQEEGGGRLSKIILGVFGVALVLLCAPFIQFVPLAVFGGVVLKIAFDVADFTAFRTLLQSDKKMRWVQWLILIGTIISTVLISLNLAVIGFTIFFIFWNKLVSQKYQVPDFVAHTETQGLDDEL